MTGAVKDLNSVPVTGKDCHCVNQILKTRTLSPVYCHVASHVLFAGGLPQKKGINPDHQRAIKSVKSVSCVNHLSSVQNVTNVPPVVPNLPVGTRLHQFWKKWAALGVSPKVLAVLREGYILPFRPISNKLLCKSPQEKLPVGGIVSAVGQKCCKVSSKSTVPGLLQPVISGTQIQQPVATYLRPEHTEQLLENTIVQKRLQKL